VAIVPFGGYKIQIVDFSNDYFRQRRDGMPEDREGKFVLMRDNGRKMDYLALSPSEQCTYHAEIVERFCRRFRIRVSKTERPRRFLIQDSNWVVAGGIGMVTKNDFSCMESRSNTGHAILMFYGEGSK
jgi:hypothetical protein